MIEINSIHYKYILYINSTVRKESRTDELARHLLKQMDGNVTEINLEEENIEPLTSITLSERDEILSNNDFLNEKLKYARQFSNADVIVRPIGLCKASNMYFISTAGGKFIPDFSYDYIKVLSKQLFGIKNTDLVYAEDLDNLI